MITTPPRPRPAGGPCRGPTYPVPGGAGRGLPTVLPTRGLPHLPAPPRRVGRLPRAADHLRGLAGHRAGGPPPPRYRLLPVLLRRLGVGRTRPDPVAPHRRTVDPDRHHLARRR